MCSPCSQQLHKREVTRRGRREPRSRANGPDHRIITSSHYFTVKFSHHHIITSRANGPGTTRYPGWRCQPPATWCRERVAPRTLTPHLCRGRIVRSHHMYVTSLCYVCHIIMRTYHIFTHTLVDGVAFYVDPVQHLDEKLSADTSLAEEHRVV